MTTSELPAGLIELIEDAANILCWRGHLDPEADEIPDEIVAELIEVWQAGACEYFCPWKDGGNPDAIADHYLGRKQAEYERSLPTWTCDCGETFKVLPIWGGQEDFYRVEPDGLLGDRAGGIKRTSKGKVKSSDSCPGCGHSFADTITRQTVPDGALF